MASDQNQGADQAQGADIEAGNYEVIRARLVTQGQALKAKADALNAHRKETFGGTELSVSANARVRTENNCVPRDIVQVGGRLLMGYNVFLGLKQETSVDDVLSLQSFSTGPDGAVFEHQRLEDLPSGFLNDPQFVKDFTDLYKYYRDTHLIQLRATDSMLLAVFRVGEAANDIKVFRWRLRKDDTLGYVDNRGDRDYTFPASHDFEWRLTTREMQVHGEHPHINIEDICFVETVGGDLTIKVEDNTSDGHGIYREDVEDANQTLDDGEIHYARVGTLVLFKIKPYRETEYRYLVFNSRTQTAARIDAIGKACVQLPEDHGIIFPGGYYLQSGEYKVFDNQHEGLRFKKVLKAPNGEDALYVFYQPEHGLYALLPYNLINKSVQNPIYCHGYSIFNDGQMVVFRTVNEEATRVHPMQVWQTPFVSAEFAAAVPTDDSFLSKVGNAELVRGISEALSIHRLVSHSSPDRQTYEDLINAITRMGDAYYWLDHAEVDFKPVLAELSRTAELIVDEFEKVVAFRERAAEVLKGAEARSAEVTQNIRSQELHSVESFMTALTALRSLRGELITHREVRYIDRARLDALEAASIEHFDRITRECVQFLLHDEALAPLSKDLVTLTGDIEQCTKVAEIEPLRERLAGIATGLDLLTEVISGLQIDDATARTTILEGISEVFGQLNRVRAILEGHRKQLLGREGRAEFGAQFKLFGQSVASALAMCDTPDRCDAELGRLMVSLEELEARFSEFDEFIGDLAAKREEVLEAFGAKKQQLLDERNRRAQNILSAADRILEGVARRAGKFKEEAELNAYFATDAMILKLRQLGEQLGEIGEAIKADELLARLKSSKQDALRGLRDKLDLFSGDGNLIKLGNHRFTVNTQALDLTMVPRDDGMALHLTGTDFYEPVDDATFNQTRSYWAQTLVSEDADVYRAEYLAATLLFAAERGDDGLSVQGLLDATRDADGLLGLVRTFAQARYEEGYERGLHDADAALILEKLLNMRVSAGLLRFAPAPRAVAALFWAACEDEAARALWHRKARSLGRLRASLGQHPASRALGDELAEAIGARMTALGLPELMDHRSLAGRYLVEELAADLPRFTTSREAVELAEGLLRHLDLNGGRREFDEDLRTLADDLAGRVELCTAWLEALDLREQLGADPDLVLEAAGILTLGDVLPREPSSAVTRVEIKGVLGQHPRVVERTLTLRLDEFMSRLTRFIEVRVPGYRHYREARHEVVATARKRLRLDEFKPKIMSSFVRNKLINDVYLPMVGNNLAKQMGAAGDKKRTDLMGLLLLTSPPGYGKTTLMEYIASRLGLVFVKVNGPSLGHQVLSLDPEEAPNATARQEVEKVNLAFEMGNNVMLYLDDVQHLNPEFMQKFISLCDAQRRIEGVWRGRTRTYDMRGKKFCVIMAGNPYTETGDKFVIPDMLANRADTYNLGDILTGADDVFELSYIENALTSNSALAPLATRPQSDVYKLIAMADGEEIPTSDLEHGYSSVEINEITEVIKRLRMVQQVVLKVNQSYVLSASQDDAFRTEPPFKMQGSYRNMGRMAEQIVAAMNPAEVESLIDDHYRGESQTLTTGAENNLLKLAELRGRMSPEQEARWAEVRRGYRRVQVAGGNEDDPAVRVAGTLSGIGEQLDKIGDALSGGSKTDVALTQIGAQLSGIRTGLGQAGASEAALGQIASQLGAIQTSLGQSGATEKAIGQLAHGLAGIRAMMAQGNEAEKVFRAMAGQIQGIREALQTGSGGELGTKLDGIAQALTQRPMDAMASAPPRVAAPQAQSPQANNAAALRVVQALDGIRAALDNAGAGPGPSRGMPPLPGRPARSTTGSLLPQGFGKPSGALVETQKDFPAINVTRDDGTQVDATGMLRALTGALERVARPQIEVTVQTPKGVEELLAQQVQIVERTLVPLVQETTKNLTDAQAIGANVKELLELLRRLNARLNR
jgi:MoxR-like ATPase